MSVTDIYLIKKVIAKITVTDIFILHLQCALKLKSNNRIMNREIKFRGKTTIGEKWVFGHIIFWGSNYQIWETEQDGETHNYQVIPETVSQFTGLKDKNGKEIYEGDILDSSEKVPLIFEVYYEDGGFRYGTKDRSVDIGFSGDTWLKEILTRFHVIGNIHDNPELLS
ncbi:YopX family protein [Epilithonimonas xixisoli]|uniref:Putative phage protein (TIGR01671 family) n=1 Tax=Epilithonimonas xixisoli TaxID=1476462 RepID=A0A4R8I537_9FLAO|nr:YopX family protein [Epilithonimonas xixisoli]TDX83982.1 putative phage protein (TIGR01671 family) [Epilithonimonas xixisoli]